MRHVVSDELHDYVCDAISQRRCPGSAHLSRQSDRNVSRRGVRRRVGGRAAGVAGDRSVEAGVSVGVGAGVCGPGVGCAAERAPAWGPAN